MRGNGAESGAALDFGHVVGTTRPVVELPGARHLERRRGSAVVVRLGAAARYLPVGRCAAPRGWPARPRPPALPPRAAPWTGGGVRRTSSRRARSSGLSSVRALSVLGCTVRNTGPRTRSTTATTTFELLGVSNTIPASSEPPSVSVTSSPAPIDSIAASVLGGGIRKPKRRVRADGARGFERPTSWVRCICGRCGSARRAVVASGSGARVYGLVDGLRRSRLARDSCVCGVHVAGLVPHTRRSRDTQPISGADRRCQGQPGRAERSEPRSGGLDCRREAKLAVPGCGRGVAVRRACV